MVLGTWYEVRCLGDLLKLIEHTTARTTCLQQHIPFKRDDICNCLHAPGLLQSVISVAHCAVSLVRVLAMCILCIRISMQPQIFTIHTLVSICPPVNNAHNVEVRSF
jgi:hypothetical protein